MQEAPAEEDLVGAIMVGAEAPMATATEVAAMVVAVVALVVGAANVALHELKDERLHPFSSTKAAAKEVGSASGHQPAQQWCGVGLSARLKQRKGQP